MGRRSMLVVTEASGEMFHATAQENRQSILRHGLDWRRMGTAPGIAGSREPELPAVFLCESLEEVGFFTQMSRLPTDIWAVRVDGRWVESGPDGWIILPEPVPPERLRLVNSRSLSRTDRGRSGCLSEIYHGGVAEEAGALRPA